MLKELPEFFNVHEYQFSAKKVHPEIILRSLCSAPFFATTLTTYLHCL